MRWFQRVLLSAFWLVMTLMVVACGGGGGGGGGSSSSSVAPSALSYPSPNEFFVNNPITELNPTVQGTVTSYSVTPDLPTGLVLDSTSGIISGIPTVITPVATYTITALNSVGSTSFSISIQVIVFDISLSVISVPNVSSTAFSSIDTVDGVNLWATLSDWTVVNSVDGGANWSIRYIPTAAGQSSEARIHVSRADPQQIMVYAYTDTQTSTYNNTVFVSHDGMTTVAELTNGPITWGSIGAFSITDPNRVYIFGDNGESVVSTNGFDTSTFISPNPDFHAGSLWTGGAAEISPLNSNIAWASLGGTSATIFGQFDSATNLVTDMTAQVRAALADQTPGAMELYASGPNTYRLRVIGSQGAVATSDDLGSTFQNQSTASALQGVTGWVWGVRRFVSSVLDRNTLVSWDQFYQNLYISRDGGVTWTNVSDTPSWSAGPCNGAIGGVALTASSVVVACRDGTASVMFPYPSL